MIAALFEFLSLVLLSLLLYYSRKRLSSPRIDKWFLPGLGLHLISGLALGLVYTWYYPSGDTWRFHQEAQVLYQIALYSPLEYAELLFTDKIPLIFEEFLQFPHEPRSFLFAKVLSLLHLLTYQNYWLSGLFLSSFSFLGLWYLCKVLVEAFPSNTWAAPLACLLIPSTVFWSSGVLKDSLALGAIAALIGLSIRLYFLPKLQWRHLVVYCVLAVCVWKLKYYVLATLLPLSTGLLVIRYLHLRWALSFTKALLISAAVVLVAVVGISFSHYNLHYQHILEVMVLNYEDGIAQSAEEHAVIFADLEPSLTSFLSYLPQALMATLYRPFLGEISGVLPLIISAENLLVALLSLGAVLGFVSRKTSIKQPVLLFFALMWIISLAFLLPFAAPNWGTLSRYRIVFYPIWVYLLLLGNAWWLDRFAQSKT
ncbi:hypothetical protein QWY31_02140 [Cytophagales bacterium LB-30]|uniref:Glycosyltransferase RgtA/B/C/D-like domain-containing protein n=1 Tax=Shiella aurantiaca TaxID=3058365 RepID=A0ABT8F1E8_9BACT|nr:hypothetical protein [Shiella aurantiaca]MDN4164280.1 hypothetical protein [Shiella aurantiaca]